MTTREKNINQNSISKMLAEFFIAPALLVESPKARCRQHPGLF